MWADVFTVLRDRRGREQTGRANAAVPSAAAAARSGLRERKGVAPCEPVDGTTLALPKGVDSESRMERVSQQIAWARYRIREVNAEIAERVENQLSLAINVADDLLNITSGALATLRFVGGGLTVLLFAAAGCILGTVVAVQEIVEEFG